MRGLLVAMLVMAAGAALAQPDELDRRLAAHEACAARGDESGVCSGILTTHCLEGSETARALTTCRARVTLALEALVVVLMQELAAQGRRSEALQIADGAGRIVAEFCAALGGRMATGGGSAHDIRCAMMRAHVTVYHLVQALRAAEQAT